MAVASTHASFVDTEMLVRLAGSVGLERLVVTNPAARFGADEASATPVARSVRRAAFPVVLSEPRRRGTPASGYRKIGADRCIVSTDFGQWTNPPPQRECGWPSRRCSTRECVRPISPRSCGRILSLALGCPPTDRQCLKCRTPVKTIAMPARFAASMTSSSRIEPPGWAIEAIPA